jgi:cytochrome c
MVKRSLGLALCLGILAAPAMADAGLQLAQKNNCLSCHSVANKVVGPAYKDVAKKYAGDKGAAAKLFTKVKNGGSGVWGPIPMPANSAVSDADIKTLVKWVLSQK